MKKGLILAVVTGGAMDSDVLESALAYARLFDSHVEVLHPRLDPYRVLAGFIDGLNGLGTSDIVTGIRQDIDRRQHIAHGTFNGWVARHGLRVGADISESAGPQSGDQPTASWRLGEGTYENAMSQYGRLADLIVVAQPSAAGRSAQDAVVEAAIFDTGRPVLCIPAGQRALDLGSIAILWNGSIEAARAIGQTMPILSAGGNVVVMTGGKCDGVDPRELVERLVLRGIEARTRRVNPGEEFSPTALLDALNNGHFGLVVMGGYGHTRLREMVLGALTRHMLAEAKIPVLLAH
ncbi:universal stress protein [Dongia sp.]|uniref:universal stress protein n=1 Tax=Dongia sp. TaxID=1977262 RepID=UPI0035B29A28